MTYYQILGVSKTASQEELKNAYKTLIKKYHPDLYQGDKTFAEKKTKEINAAYDILSNPTTRAEYDDEITPKTTDITYEYTPPKYNNPSSYSYQDYYKSKTYSDFGDYDKRYTNYHRSKTPSSNYKEQKNNNNNNTSESFEDFNINDYFSDKELYEVYTESYSDIFSSFQEFKETMSYYVYLYYNF